MNDFTPLRFMKLATGPYPLQHLFPDGILTSEASTLFGSPDPSGLLIRCTEAVVGLTNLHGGCFSVVRQTAKEAKFLNESTNAMKSDFLIALTQLAAERHLPREQVLQAIEAALASAFKKDSLVAGQNISVKLNPNSTGEPVSVFALKTVVENVEEPHREITLEEARKIKQDAILDEEVAVEALPHQVSRIAAQTAKQVILQRLREVERELVFQEFVQRTDDIISGAVEQIEAGRVVVLDIGRVQAILPPEEQVPTERYRKGQRLKVFVLDVRRTSKGPEILVSRSHKHLLKRLFEIEVPEVFNGIVEIKAISREGGSRSKVAVVSRQDGIDPVGSCIGMRGNRIQSIVNELQGEKIDVVRWDKDLKVFLANALSPSEVVHVEIDEKAESALAVVPERQLSLAIGKEGQNARLAAKLTGLRLDIKSMSEWEAIKTQRHAEEEEATRAAARGEEVEAAIAVAEPEPEPVVLQTGLAQAEEVALAAEVAATELVEEAAPEQPVTEEEVLPDVQEITEAVAEVEATPALSPEEELALLAVEEEEEEEEEEAEVEELGEEVWNVPVLSTGGGQIRFAEDIMGDIRGKGRKDRKSKRGGGNEAGRWKKGSSQGRRTRVQSPSPSPSP